MQNLHTQVVQFFLRQQTESLSARISQPRLDPGGDGTNLPPAHWDLDLTSITYSPESSRWRGEGVCPWCSQGSSFYRRKSSSRSTTFPELDEQLECGLSYKHRVLIRQMNDKWQNQERHSEGGGRFPPMPALPTSESPCRDTEMPTPQALRL